MDNMAEQQIGTAANATASSAANATNGNDGQVQQRDGAPDKK